MTGRHATARHAFERVEERLKIDHSVLAYLFSECLQEILLEAETMSSCTVRGIGKFKVISSSQMALQLDTVPKFTVFERSKYQGKNTPFNEFRLGFKMNNKNNPYPPSQREKNEKPVNSST